jgi:F-type H+-transporting ATPase subunit gamma
MSSSSHLKEKLGSIEEIKDIITAMKAFAGFNLQNARHRLPYWRTYRTSIEEAAGDIVTIFPHLARIGEALPGKTLFVLFLSQEGLCGFFNETLIDFFGRLPKSNFSTVVIGEKGFEEIRAKDVACERGLKGASTPDAIESYTIELSAYLHELIEKENVATLRLIYAKHDDAGGYDPVDHKVLPPDFSAFHKASIQKKPLLYLEGETILQTLIKEYLHTACYGAFLESVASENQERLNSMVQSENAIKERVGALKLELNAMRQKEITEELLEIVNTYRSMVSKT